MSHLPQERLEKALRRTPEPIRGITEDERWIRIGPVRVSTVGARVNIGFTHGTSPNTRFELQRFAFEDRIGFAVILVGAGKLPEYFVGWVAESEKTLVQTRIDRLNKVIAQRLLNARSEVESETSPYTLIFHIGGEYAPDSPWGAEEIEVSTSGRLDYEQRRSGSLVRGVHADIDPSRVRRLLALLSATSFPTPTQTSFLPGASVCAIITEPPFQSMLIDLYDGMDTEYGSILASLAELARAIRESDENELGKWHLAAAIG